MTVHVVTDSTADLDHETLDRHGISVVRLNIHFGVEVYRDGLDLGKEAFYERLGQSAVLPRTSQPSVPEFQRVYGTFSDGEPIVSIHIGGKLSGTVNAAQTAARLRREADSEAAPVIVVDSDQASVGLGFPVVAAAEAAAAGASAEAIAETACDCAARCRVLLFVDTLEYLQKGGRIGRARAFLGTLLRTKPVLELTSGEIAGIERPRTRQKAIERLYQLIMKTPNPARIAILHGTTPDEAAALADRVHGRFSGVPVSVVQVSPVIGVHTGPAALGAAIEISRR